MSSKDDFFERINQRELEKEMARKHILKFKSCKDNHKRSRKEESSDSDEDNKHRNKKFKHFKESKTENCKEYSLPKNLPSNARVKLKRLDPTSPSTDILDDLLSSYLKPKGGSVPKSTATSTAKESSERKHSEKSTRKEPSRKEVNVDNSEVIAGVLDALPTKTFLNLMYSKMKKIVLEDSVEINLLLKIISEAQEVLCKKLPPNVQAQMKAKFSEKNSKSTTENVKNTTVSQNAGVESLSTHKPSTEVAHNNFLPSNLQVQNSTHNLITEITKNYSTIPAISQVSSTVPIPVIYSQAGTISSTQTFPGRFAEPGFSYNAAYPSNFPNNMNPSYFPMMYQNVYQNRQPVPLIASTSSVSTSTINTAATANTAATVNRALSVNSVPNSSNTQSSQNPIWKADSSVSHINSVPNTSNYQSSQNHSWKAFSSVPHVNSVPNTSSTQSLQNSNQKAASQQNKISPEATLNDLKMLSEEFQGRKNDRESPKRKVEYNKSRTKYNTYKYSKDISDNIQYTMRTFGYY